MVQIHACARSIYIYDLHGKRPLTEQPVGFAANYEEEPRSLPKLKTSAPTKQSGPASSVNRERVVFVVLILHIPR